MDEQYEKILNPLYKKGEDADTAYFYPKNNNIGNVIRLLQLLLPNTVVSPCDLVLIEDYIHFDIDNREALVDEAIILAIGDARRKPELMAKAAGVRLVRIVNVNTNQGGTGPRREAVAFSAQAVPVMGGELAISASVTMEWEIAPQ